jgi:uncharacterized protein (DUF2236 family)
MSAQIRRSSPAPSIGETELEARLAWARDRAAGEREGLFGPQSLSWRVDREAALFLGAGRALLLQLAHPWVAAAIAQHSTTLTDPIGRFHRTFDLMFTLVFGTPDQALGAARRLHRRHASITGVLPGAAGPFAAGSPYRANEASALLWVHATLVESALLAHDLVLPPLSAGNRERYYAESKGMAALFAIPEDLLPPDWPAFEAYCRAMHESEVLTVTAEARAIAEALLIKGARRWLRPPRWYRCVTARLMPARLRQDFALAFGPDERRRGERAIARLRRLYPRLPGQMRFVGPYREALARLAGRPPDLLTRASNRLWIGRPALGQ